MKPFTLKIFNKEECKELTDELFYLYNSNQTVHDNRCPISNAVYGATLHKNNMQRISNIINNELDITLVPTFVYSRIYRPGEILHSHTDRIECEYTASITLGYSGDKSWEIFVEDYDGKVYSFIPEIGEAVIFKGSSMKHYRHKFLGEWQTQSIYSFVNSNGALANLAWDPKHANSVPVLNYELYNR